MTDKNRAINTGPKSGMAQARKEFYGNAIPRIKRAIEHLFPLEAIALLESMMADRLESRLAYIFKQRADKRKFSTIGQLVEELCGKKSTESHEEKAVYGHVKTWGPAAMRRSMKWSNWLRVTRRTGAQRYKTPKRLPKLGCRSLVSSTAMSRS